MGFSTREWTCPVSLSSMKVNVVADDWSSGNRLYWIDAAGDIRKVIMDIPFSARLFLLTNQPMIIVIMYVCMQTRDVHYADYDIADMLFIPFIHAVMVLRKALMTQYEQPVLIDGVFLLV